MGMSALIVKEFLGLEKNKAFYSLKMEQELFPVIFVFIVFKSLMNL